MLKSKTHHILQQLGDTPMWLENEVNDKQYMDQTVLVWYDQTYESEHMTREIYQLLTFLIAFGTKKIYNEESRIKHKSCDLVD